MKSNIIPLTKTSSILWNWSQMLYWKWKNKISVITRRF
jgi:hypothetical protein